MCTCHHGSGRCCDGQIAPNCVQFPLHANCTSWNQLLPPATDEICRIVYIWRQSRIRLSSMTVNIAHSVTQMKEKKIPKNSNADYITPSYKNQNQCYAWISPKIVFLLSLLARSITYFDALLKGACRALRWKEGRIVSETLNFLWVFCHSVEMWNVDEFGYWQHDSVHF